MTPIKKMTQKEEDIALKELANFLYSQYLKEKQRSDKKNLQFKIKCDSLVQ